MKISSLIFPLFFVNFVASASIEVENTELIPDMASDLIDASDAPATVEIERTKKSPKTTCYETKVGDKSILQCADDPETSETIALPSISSAVRHGSTTSGLEIPTLNFPSFNSLLPGYKSTTTQTQVSQQPSSTAAYQNYASPTQKPNSISPNQVTPSSTQSYSYTTQRSSYASSSSSSSSSQFSSSKPETSITKPAYFRHGSSSAPTYIQPQQTYIQPAQQTPMYPQIPSYAATYPKSASDPIYYSEMPQQTSYVQPSRQSSYSSGLYSYSDQGYQPYQSAEGYRAWSSDVQPAAQYTYSSSSSTSSQPSSKNVEDARIKYESALAEYQAARASETSRTQAEYEQARAHAEFDEIKAEYEASRAAESARQAYETSVREQVEKHERAQAEYARNRADYEKAQAEYQKNQARVQAEYQKSQAIAQAEYQKNQAIAQAEYQKNQARAQAEYAEYEKNKAEYAEYEKMEAEYERNKAEYAEYEKNKAEYEKMNAESMAEYDKSRAASPVYVAPHPVQHYEAVPHTYPSPAPPVPCPTNLLFSCVPHVAPVPCVAASYEKQSPPPVYTRPAPQSYYPQPNYRQSKRESDDFEVNAEIQTGQPQPVDLQLTPSDENIQLSSQDWS